MNRSTPAPIIDPKTLTTENSTCESTIENFHVDAELRQTLNHAERKLAVRDFTLLLKQHPVYLKESFKYERVIPVIVEELDKCIFKKSECRIGDAYRT